jgi:hypothetical protein
MVSAGISVLDGELIPAPGGDGCGYEVHGSEVMITLNMGVDIQGNLPEDECLLPDLACSDFSKIFEEHLEVYKRMMGDFSLEIPLAEPEMSLLTNESAHYGREKPIRPSRCSTSTTAVICFFPPLPWGNFLPTCRENGMSI